MPCPKKPARRSTLLAVGPWQPRADPALPDQTCDYTVEDADLMACDGRNKRAHPAIQTPAAMTGPSPGPAWRRRTAGPGGPPCAEDRAPACSDEQPSQSSTPGGDAHVRTTGLGCLVLHPDATVAGGAGSLSLLACVPSNPGVVWHSNFACRCHPQCRARDPRLCSRHRGQLGSHGEPRGLIPRVHQRHRHGTCCLFGQRGGGGDCSGRGAAGQDVSAEMQRPGSTVACVCLEYAMAAEGGAGILRLPHARAHVHTHARITPCRLAALPGDLGLGQGIGDPPLPGRAHGRRRLAAPVWAAGLGGGHVERPCTACIRGQAVS